ncbi:NifB/NifX family molybdenum-iron cluster-binding protein [Hippea maritima]|uniref:Dinitrogenase iron-molybdenum cofactor biosynthesis protein n=1 Tax=Hippea maritima (strain ATCC 700847 / DSM 10411 / MH2) TaxID=760142 RepID=F2LX04_HIPMA|nr:NifB/NifX family molybdenum-iron cluster-binding protein [Hippea maritima]AEA34188.1 Dinitrogenase iron-molybdenum cofactor biosynthesis protein [Hippea maritima DSM 10411]
MKIMITAKGDKLESTIDERYGRGEYFIIYDTDSGEFEAIKNPFLNNQGGVGVSTAQFSVEKGINAIISGSYGPNALEILRSANLELYKAQQGTVKDNIELLKEGKLERF